MPTVYTLDGVCLEVGTPTTTPPEGAIRDPRSTWEIITDTARTHAGRWVPFHLPDHKGSTLVSLPRRAARGKIKALTPATDWQVSYDGDRLWVRYQGATSHTDALTSLADGLAALVTELRGVGTAPTPARAWKRWHNVTSRLDDLAGDAAWLAEGGAA